MSSWDATTQMMLAISEAQQPSVAQFLAHSDHRQIASFFLGWVFIASLFYVSHSTLVQSLYWRANHAVSRRMSPAHDSEASRQLSEKYNDSLDTDSITSRWLSPAENATLTFTLSLCFLLSSIAFFASLVNFNSETGGAACAFVVAWAGVASQCTRLVGLIILLLELRQLGKLKWETIAFSVLLTVGIVLVFASNAISVGTIRPIPQLGVAICYKKHFLPTSLTGSLVFLALEIYCVARMVSFIAPSFLSSQHKFNSVLDIRVLRGLSLVVLELFTIVPSAIPTSTVGDFVPFCLGALLVMYAFNKRAPETVRLHMDSIPASIYSSPSLATRLSIPANPRSMVAIPTTRLPQPRIAHPFSANLDDYKLGLQGHEWLGRNVEPDTARSSSTIDSIMAKSIAAAKVQTASRTRRPDLVPPTPSARKSHFAELSGDEWRNSQHFMPAGLQQQPMQSGKILPSQAEYAMRFEQEALPVGLGVRRPTPMVYIPSSEDDETSPVSNRSYGNMQGLNSAVLGSDIIYGHRDATKTLMSRNNSRVSFANSYAQDGYADSPDGSYYGGNARQSWYSISEGIAQGDRSVVSPMSRTPTTGAESVRTYRTFGNFGRYEPPTKPALLGLPSGPRMAPGQRLGGIGLRGPRPPPAAFSPTQSHGVPTKEGPPMSRRQEKKKRVSTVSSLRSEIVPSGRH